MKKYFFFDIDGTLTLDKHGDGRISDQTVATIKKLQENGHFVAIATGRSYAMAQKYGDMIGVANYVINGGYGIVIDGQIEEIEPLERDKCVKICQEATQKGLGVAIVVDDSLNYYCGDNLFQKKSNGALKAMVPNESAGLDYSSVDQFHKVYVSISADEERMLKSKELIPYMRYTDSTLVFEGDNKYLGIQKMIDAIGGLKEHVVVFGDGKNDISMFKEAPFSIAMGNAVPELLLEADFVTKNNMEDGITYACEIFGWI